MQLSPPIFQSSWTVPLGRLDAGDCFPGREFWAAAVLPQFLQGSACLHLPLYPVLLLSQQTWWAGLFWGCGDLPARIAMTLVAAASLNIKVWCLPRTFEQLRKQCLLWSFTRIGCNWESVPKGHKTVILG